MGGGRGGTLISEMHLLTYSASRRLFDRSPFTRSERVFSNMAAPPLCACSYFFEAQGAAPPLTPALFAPQRFDAIPAPQGAHNHPPNGRELDLRASPRGGAGPAKKTLEDAPGRTQTSGGSKVHPDDVLRIFPGPFSANWPLLTSKVAKKDPKS